MNNNDKKKHDKEQQNDSATICIKTNEKTQKINNEERINKQKYNKQIDILNLKTILWKTSVLQWCLFYLYYTRNCLFFFLVWGTSYVAVCFVSFFDFLCFGPSPVSPNHAKITKNRTEPFCLLLAVFAQMSTRLLLISIAIFFVPSYSTQHGYLSINDPLLAML